MFTIFIKENIRKSCVPYVVVLATKKNNSIVDFFFTDIRVETT